MSSGIFSYEKYFQGDKTPIITQKYSHVLDQLTNEINRLIIVGINSSKALFLMFERDFSDIFLYSIFSIEELTTVRLPNALYLFLNFQHITRPTLTPQSLNYLLLMSRLAVNDVSGFKYSYICSVLNYIDLIYTLSFIPSSCMSPLTSA